MRGCGRRPRRRLPRPLLALALLALASPAQADPLQDAATGLRIDPPPGYHVARMAPSGAQTARFSLRRPEDQDTGCQLAYVPAPQNAALSQAQINGRTGTPGWQSIERARLSTAYAVLEEAIFEQGGITGLELTADLRPQAGLPPRAQALRSLFVILETPRGRTTLVCVAEKADFAARRVEFEALARGVAPPR